MKSAFVPSPKSFGPFTPNNFKPTPKVECKSGDVGPVSLEKRTAHSYLSSAKIPTLNFLSMSLFTSKWPYAIPCCFLKTALSAGCCPFSILVFCPISTNISLRRCVTIFISPSQFQHAVDFSFEGFVIIG